MKYDCKIVRDLMPLVQDGIASDESVNLVNEHKRECMTCKSYYNDLSHNLYINTVYDVNEHQLYESACVTTYGNRIKKRRKTTILALLLGIVGLLIIQATIILGSVGALSFLGKEYTTTDAAQYGKYIGHIGKESSGMFGDLLVFPSGLPNSAHIENYYYYCSDKGLDNSYQIFLEYSLSSEDFQKENQRLSNLSVTYEGITNKALYDTNGFNYPAYVAAFGDNETYEYALLDSDNNRIICVFSQFQNLDGKHFKKNYLPSGTSVIGNAGYSMYYFPSIADKRTRVKP